MDDWIYVIILLLILDESKEGQSTRNQVHSWYRKQFLISLDIVGRRIRQRKIPRCCLWDTSESAWRKLYEAQNDQGMITLTGFDCASFASLCVLFAPVFDWPQLGRAPIVKVLYKQANIAFAAEAVFFWGGGKGAFRPKKGCNAPSAGYYGFLRKKILRKLHTYCKLL